MLLFIKWDERANELAASDLGRRGKELTQHKASSGVCRGLGWFGLVWLVLIGLVWF